MYDAMIDGMDFWNDLTTSFAWKRNWGFYEIMGVHNDRRHKHVKRRGRKRIRLVATQAAER